MSAKTLAAPVLAGARRRKQEYDKVQGVATTVRLRRARVLMLLVVSLHTAFAVCVGYFQTPPGQDNLQTWADALTRLQGGVALGLLVCGLMAHALLCSQRGGGFAGVAVQTDLAGFIWRLARRLQSSTWLSATALPPFFGD